MTTPPRRHPLALKAGLALSILGLGLALVACEPEEAQVEVDAGDTKPLVPVSLPPVPSDLGKSETPDKHSDGSLTIDGLMRNRRVHLDKNIAVKGYIVWIYDCPYDDDKKKRRRGKKKKKAEGEEENLCQRNHFYIADKAGTKPEDSLLVVNLNSFFEELIEKEELKIGEQYTFEGEYTDIGDGFAAPDEGLLMLAAIQGFEPEEEK